MLINKAKYLITGILVMTAIQSFSVCPEMEVWSDGIHYRYLIKDWHRDLLNGHISLKQQTDIIWAAQQQKNQGAFLLTEDSHSYSGSNKKIHNTFNTYLPKTIHERISTSQNLSGIAQEKISGAQELIEASPLDCLARTCASHGIMSHNAECSQSFELCESDCPPVVKITIHEALHDLEENIAEIGACPALKENYQAMTAQYKKLKEKAPIMPEKEFLDGLYQIRSELVNHKTINKLIEWNNIKHGFIFEGQAHIELIKNGLKAMGYKHSKSIGNPTIWSLPYKTMAEETATSKHMLSNALDLRRIFKEIFEEQQKEWLSMPKHNQKLCILQEVVASYLTQGLLA